MILRSPAYSSAVAWSPALGAAGRSRVESYFSVVAMAERYREIYQRAIE